MHELAVTESVMRIATEHAQEAGATRVTAIHLVIGQIASFVDDSIQFYFDLLTPGTMLEGAQLYFHRRPVQFRCRSCGTLFAPEGRDWHCPSCQSLGGEVVSGREFFMESIEVE
jgi:hydrogenase nickel incorporation protein HypA/HybF